MHRIRAVESISAVHCCSVYVPNSEKQRYIMNTYILILLLSAIALINVQAASKSRENSKDSTKENNSKDSTETDVSSGTKIDTSDDDRDNNRDDDENNTTIRIDDDNKNDSSVNTDDNKNDSSVNTDDNKNDSSVNTDDGNNKNNTSVNTDNDNGINNTSINTGDDNDENNTSINTGDNNNKNNTSVNTGNDNDKNDTSACTNNGKIPDEDVKHNIRIITECMIRSKGIGNLVMHITRLTKVVFLVVPSLRDPFMNYYYNIFELVFGRLIQLNNWLQYLEAIIRRNLPFLGSSILYP